MLKNKASISLLIVFFASLALAVPRFASAHVLETDGSIGAVLHIDPDDNPKPNEKAIFLLEFKDTDDKFHLYNCVCTYSLTKEGKTFASGNLTSVSEEDHNSASFSYTFPEEGEYEIEINGSSSDNSFPDFTLQDDLEVDADQNSNANFLVENWRFAGLVGLLVIFGSGIFIYSKLSRKPKT